MMRLSFVYVLLISFLSTLNVEAQTARRVKFPSKDGVTITADMYEANPDYPWIVLFHKAQSSRGEFQRIAVKLNKLELNCMAVDLRSGKEANFIVNEGGYSKSVYHCR
jgi:HJR/Mrr/RecB family endonuclease